MILKYGNYTFDANSVLIDRRIETLLSPDNVPYAEKHTWDVAGELILSTHAALIAANTALARALGTPYKDLKFFADDGTTLAFALTNATSLDGVKILNFRNPPTVGAFATFVPFEFTAEATYQYAPSGTDPVMVFQESLSFSGGGPRHAFVECVNSLPVKQLVIPSTVYRATQTGRAEGLSGWPNPPGPIWPADELRSERSIVYDSPDREGGGFSMFGVSWTYQFASAVPLNGQPRQTL